MVHDVRAELNRALWAKYLGLAVAALSIATIIGADVCEYRGVDTSYFGGDLRLPISVIGVFGSVGYLAAVVGHSAAITHRNSL
jgi:hypothetical protein